MESHKEDVPKSKRQEALKRRKRNRDNQERIADLKQQRDVAVGLLADANLLIVELTEELADTRRRLDLLKPSTLIIPFPERSD